MRPGSITLDEGPIVTHRVVAMDVHPSYSKTAEFDVGRMTLEEPIVFNERVRPVCLPRGTTLPDNGWESATIAGESAD